MNEELRELYQEIILDHNKNPKNFKDIENATHHAEGHNPLCGDKIDLSLKVENDKIDDIGFQGSGCAISKASASVMTSALKGCKVEEAEAMFEKFENMIKSNVGDELDYAGLGKLAAFAGVREFPTRIKCASLAWHTMKSALHEKDKATTE